MVNLGEKIKEIFDTKSMSVVEFGKKINTSRENVYTIFKRPTIDSHLLARISEVLDFNFFDLIIPEKFKIKKQDHVDGLMKTIEVYETEIRYLKEINSLKDKLSGSDNSES